MRITEVVKAVVLGVADFILTIVFGAFLGFGVLSALIKLKIKK